MTKLPEPEYMGCDAVSDIFGYTESQMLQFRRDVLEEVIQCYSPDDTAADWTDKIRKLKDET